MFGLTAFLFLIFGIIGYVTNLDLSKIGTILFIGLVGIILVGLVNFFLGNTILDMIICIVGIVIFLGLVMYDVNKIKAYLMDGDAPNKMAIYGALELYLDFINIFLYLLRLFGKSND
jgi:FtsH-binding integral membrane protein